jgi:hypothetical protein
MMRKLLRWLFANSRRTAFAAALLLPLVITAGISRGETPEQFAHRFAKFKFEFHAEVQDPAVFLKTKKGDCDDFATIADDFLTREGYTTHLITVRMPGETHVVLYVEESHAYLDYNFRAVKHPSIPTDGVLTHIATQVADSFGLPWLGVYEFNYHDNMKHLVSDIVMNDRVNPIGHQMQVAAAGSQHARR